jgi:ATP-dependent Lhr-like helicase
VFQGFPGQGQSSRQLQASSGLIHDVFAEYDPDNPLPASITVRFVKPNEQD